VISLFHIRGLGEVILSTKFLPEVELVEVASFNAKLYYLHRPSGDQIRNLLIEWYHEDGDLIEKYYGVKNAREVVEQKE
jgi:hypothetical protein